MKPRLEGLHDALRLFSLAIKRSQAGDYAGAASWIATACDILNKLWLRRGNDHETRLEYFDVMRMSRAFQEQATQSSRACDFLAAAESARLAAACILYLEPDGAIRDWARRDLEELLSKWTAELAPGFEEAGRDGDGTQRSIFEGIRKRADSWILKN